MSTRAVLVGLMAGAFLVASCAGGAGNPGVSTTSSAGPGAGSSAPSQPTAAGVTVPTAKGGQCTVTVTGDLDLELSYDQSIYSMGSDYWTSEEDLRATVETLGEDIAGGSYDELTARGEPVVTFLSLSCQDPNNLVQGALATHNNATRRPDMPMGPGVYPISGGLGDAAEGQPGSIIAGFATDDDALWGTVDNSGSLEITKWDMSAIEGSFQFDAEEGLVESPRMIHVLVEFSFLCSGFHSGC